MRYPLAVPDETLVVGVESVGIACENEPTRQAGFDCDRIGAERSPQDLRFPDWAFGREFVPCGRTLEVGLEIRQERAGVRQGRPSPERRCNRWRT